MTILTNSKTMFRTAFRRIKEMCLIKVIFSGTHKEKRWSITFISSKEIINFISTITFVSLPQIYSKHVYNEISPRYLIKQFHFVNFNPSVVNAYSIQNIIFWKVTWNMQLVVERHFYRKGASSMLFQTVYPTFLIDWVSLLIRTKESTRKVTYPT